MSSPFSLPSNKPLEHLKVTELKDELRKRGLSLKGVKKELLDRLEEAIRKEVEVAGISLGEPVFSGYIQQHETVKADVLTSTHEVKVYAPIDVRPHVDTHCNVKMDAHVDTHGDVRVDSHVDVKGDLRVDSHGDVKVDTHKDVKVDAHVDTHQDLKGDALMDTHQDVISYVHMDTTDSYENQVDGTASASQDGIWQIKETPAEYGFAPEGMDITPKGLNSVAAGNDGIVSGNEDSSLTDLPVLNVVSCAQDYVDEQNGIATHSADVNVLTEDLEPLQSRPELMMMEVEDPHGQEQAPLHGQKQAKYSVVDPPHGQEQAQKAEYPVLDSQEAEHILVDTTHEEFPGVGPSLGQVNIKEVEYLAVDPPQGQAMGKETKSSMVDTDHGQVHTGEVESSAVDPPHGQAESEETACPVVDPPHGQEETHEVDPAHGEEQTDETKCTLVDPYLGQTATDVRPFIQPLELVRSAEASYNEEMSESRSAAFMDTKMKEMGHFTSQPTTPEHVPDLPDSLDLYKSDEEMSESRSAAFINTKMKEMEHFTSQPTTPEHVPDLPDSLDLYKSDGILTQGSFLDTKGEQEEIKTQPEVEPAVVSVGCRQMAVEQEKLKSDCSRMQKYGDEHIRKEIDLKSADAESHDDACPKRKYNESKMKHQEPAKRMRRWNSGICLVGEVSEPLTTETVKEIMSVEVKEDKSTPKVLAASRSSTQSVVRAEHVANGENNKKPQSVPAPLRPPTTSLKIERFIRPFTLKAVKDLLAAYGHYVDFWMDQIKTHCYVSYSAVDEAIAARNALYGRQWPSTFGNQLVAEFVDVQEVKIRCEGQPEMENVTPVTTPGWRSSIAPSQTASVHTSTAPLPPPPPSRERQALLPLKRESVPPIVTLEDLFKKTKVKPHIYYLPLTDEQVAAKLGVTTKKRQSKFSALVRSLNA